MGCLGAALACLRRTTARSGLLLVLAGTAALRLFALTPVVPLSDDLYRYAWDGAVQAAGTDPYRYPPTAPGAGRPADGLAVPRRRGVRPARQGPRLHHHQPAGGAHHLPARRAGLVPARATSLGASHLEDLGWQLIGLLADLATATLLWRLLLARGRDPRWVAVYAWSPVAVLEAVQNGHVDALATLFVVGAVALAGRRPAWSGAALGAAAMVKLYPALLLPVLLCADRCGS